MDLLSSQSFVGIMNEAQSGTAKMDQITRGIRPNQSPSEMDTVARDFEAVFLTEMMRPMFESVEVDSMFGGGRAEEIFKSMLLNEYGKSLANDGGIGMASHVKDTLIKMQGGGDVAASADVEAVKVKDEAPTQDSDASL